MDEEEGNRHRHGQALVAETTADADAALRGARGLYEKLRSGAVKDGMAREKISEPVHVFELELEIRGESVHSTMGTSAESESALTLYAPCFAYKKVANKVRPVPATLPEDYRIERVPHPDPLRGLPELPLVPQNFVPGTRLTQERFEQFDWDPEGFLTDEEKRLVQWLVRTHEKAFAWSESEKGRFDEEYFPPVLIPTVEHVPWVLRNIPIPNGIYDQVIRIIKEKVESGVYEPSNSSYRSRWFCVVKKDGKSLRLVHDLQPLNAVTIKDAGVPPFVEQVAESYAGRACYSSYDLFVAFDQRALDARSRDLTTFQTPMGTYRLTSLPMGYTNSMQILSSDVRFMLRDFIPEVTEPFIDDVMTKGPKTRYEKDDGTYETIQGNPGIRRFVFEHLEADNKILQIFEAYGVTASGPKARIAQPTALIVGHQCTYEGRIPDESKVKKIVNWPECRNVTEVRGFLGTASVLRIFIKDFAMIARPLVALTRKNAEFNFDDDCRAAMEQLKAAIVTSPALRPIDYASDQPVILAVDSSYIGFGYILLQLGTDKKRYPSRFGSGTWNERESRYSQPKVELYGLFRALRAVRIYIIGVKNLVVEVDAKYIRGMINNPDIQPNATINRWIAGILLFHFVLVHVAAARHVGADGMSRRPRAEGDDPDDTDAEDWLDEAYSFMFDKSPNWKHEWMVLVLQTEAEVEAVPEEVQDGDDDEDEEQNQGRSKRQARKEQRLEEVKEFLRDPVQFAKQNRKTEGEFKNLIRYALEFFIIGPKLWKKGKDGHHRLVPEKAKRRGLVAAAHDELGHKGVLGVKGHLTSRFWWPGLEQDVKWYVRTCYECQTRQFRKQHVTPTVPVPAPLFEKVYVDTMLMPKAGRFRYIVQARCSLTGWPEFRMMAEENGKNIADFIFENVICRWGAVREIVSDNGGPYVAALKELADKYHIRHIRISPYNSQANGLVERRHRDVREVIMKMVKGQESKWPSVVHAAFWAERITVQKATGLSPFQMVHGIEPLLPFDLAEGTYLAPVDGKRLSPEELVAARTKQLLRRPQDLEEIKDKISKARFTSAQQFEKEFKNTIKDRIFKPGDLVMVRNTRVEKELNRKTKPRYLGPYAVVRRTKGGAYILAELDGSIWQTRFAAFRVVPYYAREKIEVSIEELTELSKEELENLDSAEDYDTDRETETEEHDGESEPEGEENK